MAPAQPWLDRLIYAIVPTRPNDSNAALSITRQAGDDGLAEQAQAAVW